MQARERPAGPPCDVVSAAGVASVSAWLLEHGGPAIRHRILKDVLDEGRSDQAEAARRESLALPRAGRWLDYLEAEWTGTDAPLVVETVKDLNRVHGGGPTLENALVSLAELGATADHPTVRRVLGRLRAGLFEPALELASGGVSAPAYEPRRRFWLWFASTVLLGPALALETRPDPLLGELARVMLRWSWAFAAGPFASDPHLPPAEAPRLPPAYARYPVLRPEAVPDGRCALPTVYLLHALARWAGRGSPHLGAGQLEVSDLEAIRGLLDYAFAAAYQSLPHYLGVCHMGRRRAYVHGWKIAAAPWPGARDEAWTPYTVRLLEHLALLGQVSTGDPGAMPAAAAARPLLQRLLAMREERPRAAGVSAWYFGQTWLDRRDAGYWIGGGCGALESEKGRAAGAVESTFRLARILAWSAGSVRPGPRGRTCRPRGSVRSGSPAAW